MASTRIIVTICFILTLLALGVWGVVAFIKFRRKTKRLDEAMEFFTLCGKLFPHKLDLLTGKLYGEIANSKQPIYKYLRVFLDSELSIVG
jgi:hypothetical protein